MSRNALSLCQLGTVIMLTLQAQHVASVPFNSQTRQVSKPAINGYTYEGCYVEPNSGRALEIVKADDLMTLEMCAEICSISAKKTYFGVEYGKECWCGSALAPRTTIAEDDAECSFTCPGNLAQTCGAGFRLSLYKNDNVVTAPVAAAKSTVGNYVHQGCYSDLIQGHRALSRTSASDAMTPESCAAFCGSNTYMALEYARECWCGNDLDGNSQRVADQADCNMPCAGDSNSLCGGPARINLYKLNQAAAPSSTSSAPISTATDRVGDYLSQGCWTDENANGRTLSTLYAADDMTIDKCATWAASNGFQHFGIEYSRECWGGNALNPKSGAADFASCSMKCSGNANEVCGGPDRLSLYSYSPAPSSTSSEVAMTSSSTPVPFSDVAVSTLSSLSDIITSISSFVASPSGSSTQAISSTATGDLSSRPSRIPLKDASVENAQIQDIDGKTVIVMSPSTGGEAKADLPITSPADIQPGDQVQVQVTYQTEDVTVFKRATLTECILTMYLGPTLIYQNKIWTTDGSYTTVTSMPTGPSGVTTLIIVQFCPTTSIPIVIADVNVMVTPASSASSNEPQPTTISTSTFVPAPAATPAGTTSNTIPMPTPVPATTGTPLTSSTPSAHLVPQTTTPSSTVPLYRAQAYTTGACSRSGSGNCVLSGAPVATSGLLAAATPIPVLNSGNPTQAYELCARMCQNTIGCNSWALDRTLSDNAPEWKCYFYSGVVSSYAVSPNPIYNDIVWFSKDCYGCMQQAQILYVAQLSTSSAVVAPTTSTPEATSLTSSISPSITVAPARTFSASPYDPALCSFGRGPNCILSGAPVATPGLLAVATGIPPLQSSQSYEVQYKQCAQACKQVGCTSYALDRPATGDWTCYLYSGSVREYAVQYDGTYRQVVWFASECYNCTLQASASTHPTIASTTTVPLSTLLASSSASSTKSVRPGITPPPGITTIAMPTTVTETNCPLPTVGQWYTAGCTLSGAPLQTSGLVAVATGIPATPSGAVTNAPFEHAYQACAQMCAAMPNCHSWALDRGMWPSDYSDWTCYFYSAGARIMAPQNQGQSWIVWMDKMCYDCKIPSSALPSSTSSVAPAITPTPTITIAATSVPVLTTTRPPQEPYAFAAPTYTSGVCATKSNPANQAPCAISGWPTPASMSGLLAIATGVPPNPSGSFNFEQPFQVCAKACAAVNGCTVWAVDRGNWPTDMSAWSCLMYNFNGRNYLLNNSPSSAFSKYAWSDSNCYNCTLNQQAISSSSSSSSSSPASVSSPSDILTTSTPAATITTFSAPPLVTTCNRPTAAQWYTNGCTMSGVATATTSLLAVATGIAPNAAGDFNFEPAYQRCASICAGITGCQGYALDRTNTTSWNCNFHNMPIQPYISRQSFTVNNRAVVWMSMLCYDCPVPGPWPPVASSPSSSTVVISTTSRPTETGVPAPPSTTTSTSATLSIQGNTETTSPAKTSSVPTTCTRAASAPPTAACSVKGFRQPAGQAKETHVYTQADCAAYCATQGTVCKSYAWIPASGWCGVYSLDIWTAIGDDAVAGRAYRDYVMDEPGCFICTEGVAVKYLPA
ncbi:wsc domain-containing protein [Colletotrichum incanum]|uniref:Wsc domain-containing protein n=1 Tax=Colletotrichum incanum TaxID=1573173 RepID=A0A167DSH4_COLIC|nr:wsc domain-containing protein [Colletotrichum incanum]